MLKKALLPLLALILLLDISCAKDPALPVPDNTPHGPLVPAGPASPPSLDDITVPVVGTYVGIRITANVYANHTDTGLIDSAYTYQVISDPTGYQAIYVGGMHAGLHPDGSFTQAGGPLGLYGFGNFYGIGTSAQTIYYEIDYTGSMTNPPSTHKDIFYGTKQ